jgi:hypothetical protein
MAPTHASLSRYLWRYGLAAVLLLGASLGVYLLSRKAIRSLRRNSAEQQAGSDPNSAAALAQAMRAAFEPWGISWFWGGGTDEEALYDIARRMPSMQTYAEVGKQYRKLYNENLQARLMDELDSSEQAKFFTILNSKGLKGLVRWELRTTQPTRIYLPDGLEVKRVPGGLLLGEFLKEQDAGYLFRTQRNTLRWVPKRDASLTQILDV